MPVAPDETGLLGELASRTVERVLTGLQPAGGKLEQVAADGRAQLSDEDDVALAVDRQDRDCARMVDDLALMRSPLLEDQRDEIAAVDRLGCVGQQARLATALEAVLAHGTSSRAGSLA